MDRRSFLGSAAVVGLGTLVPNMAEAGDSLHKESVRLRKQWAFQKATFMESLLSGRPGAADSPLTPLAEAMGDGLAALATVKEIENVPVEDQVHPSMQGILEDVALAIGGCVTAAVTVTESFLASDDPQKELHLRGALRSIRAGLAAWPTTLGRQNALDQLIQRLEADNRPGSLLEQVRYELGRAKKAMALSEQMSVHETGLLDSPDPQLRAKVEAGRKKWQVDAPAMVTAEKADLLRESRRKRLLGILSLSIMVPVGGIITLVSLCALACGAGPTSVAFVVIGLSLIGLGIWGGVAWLLEAQELKEEANSLGERPMIEEGAMTLIAADGWLPTSFVRRSGRSIAVAATGMVRLPGTWMADADGNGVAAEVGALVEGAPLGALVGRVGEDVFFLGRDGQVPEGPEGRLELAINQSVGEKATNGAAIGHFVVRLGSLTEAG